MKFYSKAHGKEKPDHAPTQRKPFAIAAIHCFIVLQILFLSLFAYTFGAIFTQSAHIHNINILFVDYDQGFIGQTIRNAYNSLKSPGFPTLIERPTSQFSTSDDLADEVCHIRYWAALYISPGASGRLQAALTGGTTDYEKSGVLSYIWNEARYPTTVDSAISQNLQALSNAARINYAHGNWTGIASNATAATFSLFADPWHLTSINIKPTAQGTRLVYNTLVFILVLLQEFFYLGIINGLYESFKIYSRLNPLHVFLARLILSVAYTFTGSIFTAAVIYAFRTDWLMSGEQFVLTWLTLWLFAHVNFVTLDVFTIWLPHPFIPMALISWVIFNVVSILIPFELSNPFYQWAYLMPAHEAYQILIHVWSNGCNPTLHYSLPILFALEISGIILSAIGAHRRVHYAVIKAESEKEAFQIRLNDAMAFEKQKEEQLSHKPTAAAKSEATGEIVASDELAKQEAVREELEEVLRKEDSDIRKTRTKASAISFGPAFGISFRRGEAS